MITTSNSLTLQDVFDAGVRGIFAQGTYAHDGQTCAYRVARYVEIDGIEGLSDLRCAIGHSIPNAVYSGELEGRGIYVMLTYDDDRYMGIRALFGHLDVNVLSSFQACHDRPAQSTFMDSRESSDFMAEFLRDALEYSVQNGLVWPSDVPRPL